MDETDLEAIRPELEAMTPDSIEGPRLPMATALQEAHDLLALVSNEDVWNRLTAVGLQPNARERLKSLISATRVAQSQWTVIRDRAKSQAQQEREVQAEALRSDILAACRWSLRDDRVAIGTIGAISEGEGVADLIQDLNDLAALLDSRRAAFEADKTFDAATKSEEARSKAAELQAGTSLDRLSTNQIDARSTRDRAFSLLASLVADVREAGRYAFRNEEAIRTRFLSAYLQQRRRRQSAAADAQLPQVGTPAAS